MRDNTATELCTYLGEYKSMVHLGNASELRVSHSIDFMANGEIKVFFDPYSQPSRAVLLLMNINKIRYEPMQLNLCNGDSVTREDLKEANPNQQVPAINDNGFYLAESSAILTYLVGKYNLPDHWYPSDLQKRAKINEYLHWHHMFLRRGAGHTVFQKIFAKILLGKDPNPAVLEETTTILKKSKSMLESYFLKEHKFIHSDEISIADIQAVCEFTQFWVAGVDPFEDRPRLAQWMEDCQKELQPYFDEVHKMVYDARDEGMFSGKL